MLRGYRLFIIAVVGCLFLAGLLSWSLYPEQPQLTGNTAKQEQHPQYRAGGADCDPSGLRSLVDRERAKRAIFCAEAEEQHRLSANDLLQQRRSADAADAMAILSFEQTRIAAWGVALGFITMAAAIGAAFYARKAAVHTQESVAAFKAVERCWLRVEIPSDRVAPDAAAIRMPVTCQHLGRDKASVEGIWSAILDNPQFPGSEAFAFEERPQIISGENGTVTIGYIECPTEDAYIGGWVSYHSSFPEEHRTHFLVRLALHETDADGWRTISASAVDRRGWPKDA